MFLMLSAVVAQTIPVLPVKKEMKPVEVKPKLTPAKPKIIYVEKKSSNPKDGIQVGKSVVKFICDVDAVLYIDGEKKGNLQKDIPLKINLSKGEFIVEVVSASNKTDTKKEPYTVAEANSEYILNINLSSIIQKREKEEITLLNEKTRKNEEIALNTKLSNEVQRKMVFVEGGTFTMGGDSFPNSLPFHNVTVSSFYIAKYEVTVGQYKAFCTATNRSMPNSGTKWGWVDDHPMHSVTYTEALSYCRWLSQISGKQYRLPTEAEWEYAARGRNNSNGFSYAGSNEIAEVAWYGSNSGDQVQVVGSKRANELGLYDMTGNVWEWCSDWYDANYYASSPLTNPNGPTSSDKRILRGGSYFDSTPIYCTVFFRNYFAPESRYSNFGFRVVASY